MAKKAKTKFDAKDFLLRKGEFLAMGVAGFSLVVLLIWGVTKWASAEDPITIAKDLGTKSDQVKRSIDEGKPSDAQLQDIQPPEFITKKQIHIAAKTTDFPTMGPVFDPTGTPNTKRENPNVFNVGECQVDLVRGAMPGYDIIIDSEGEPLIAVLTSKTVGTLDKGKLDSAVAQLKALGRRGSANQKRLKNNPPNNPPKNQFPMGQLPMGGGSLGPMGGGSLGPVGGGSGGKMSGSMMGSSPYGSMGGGYELNSKRADDGKVIKYVPLKEIDEALKNNNPPALTVIPVRLVTIHAVVPYKQQLEEIKRALRLATDAEATNWGPWYDGFEIQRRETRVRADGTLDILQEWNELPKDPKSTEGNFKFEENYIDKIDTRKIGDHFDEGFLPYFLKPDMMLSMPLPLLAKDLNVKYPDVRLQAILDNIKKLEDASKPKVTASEFADRLRGNNTREGMYKSRTDNTDSFGIQGNFGSVKLPGSAGPGGPPTPMGGLPTPPGGPGGTSARPGAPKLPDGYNPYGGLGAAGAAAVPVEVENFLLRFVDCDVKAGRTYEYRIRLRMWNPNFGQDKLVANPEFAKESDKLLYSKWNQLKLSITVPAEEFLYAYDTEAYRKHTVAEYEGQKELLNRLQLKDNQAVVQMAKWMEQVPAGSKREPVGGWVVTEIPVGRGEYVGRKQFVKLPLWSSESQEYLLREVADKVVSGPRDKKDHPQPKGWLVDFSTASVLVDFEGGKVKTRLSVGFDDKNNVVPKANPRTIEEEVATEMLIVRPDGKLVVRSSKVDEANEDRKDVASKWSEWLKLVESRKSATGGTGEPNPFDPKKPQ